MDKKNFILNFLQLGCFFGIGYLLGTDDMPTMPFIAIIVLAAAIDVLSSYQTRKEVEKEYEN